MRGRDSQHRHDGSGNEDLTHFFCLFPPTNMPPSITCSPKQSPFPFAAIAIAANTGTADLVFTEDVAGIVLQLDHATITDEEDIVKALAKEAGLADNSSKVIQCHPTYQNYPTLITLRHQRYLHSLCFPQPCAQLPPFPIFWRLWILSMTTSHFGHSWLDTPSLRRTGCYGAP